jgi:hypothetical protein
VCMCGVITHVCSHIHTHSRGNVCLHGNARILFPFSLSHTLTLAYTPNRIVNLLSQMDTYIKPELTCPGVCLCVCLSFCARMWKCVCVCVFISSLSLYILFHPLPTAHKRLSRDAQIPANTLPMRPQPVWAMCVCRQTRRRQRGRDDLLPGVCV